MFRSHVLVQEEPRTGIHQGRTPSFTERSHGHHKVGSCHISLCPRVVSCSRRCITFRAPGNRKCFSCCAQPPVARPGTRLFCAAKPGVCVSWMPRRHPRLLKGASRARHRSWDRHSLEARMYESCHCTSKEPQAHLANPRRARLRGGSGLRVALKRKIRGKDAVNQRSCPRGRRSQRKDATVAKIIPNGFSREKSSSHRLRSWSPRSFSCCLQQHLIRPRKLGFHDGIGFVW